MEYNQADFFTRVRAGVIDVCRDHLHDLSFGLKQSTHRLMHAGTRLNEHVCIRSRRLLYDRPTEEVIVNQTKVICRDYVYAKLRKHKLLSRDIYDKPGQISKHRLDLLRVRDETEEAAVPTKGRGSGPGTGPSDVSKQLIKVAMEFEKCFPYLYEDITDQLQLNFQSPANVQNVFMTVATEMFHKGITWAKIVALFTLTGALIVECVKQGHQSKANTVVEAMQKFVRKRLVGWIIDQGGWVGLVIHFRQKQSSLTAMRVLSATGALVGFLLAIWVTT